jgi:endonuclease YncB( thermonuclease family)
MKKELVFTIIFSSIFLLLVLALFILPYTIKNPEKFTKDLVTNVIDGDTFQYYDSDTYTFEIVRLLCIDTPEKNEEGYEEAKEFLESLILGEQITLNSSIADRDNYGRQLRYVYIDDLFVNKELLNKGYAELLIIPPEECKEILI